MGTRSLTHVLDTNSEAVLVTIYRQMDGYPSVQGEDLASILRGRRLINGFSSETDDEASNGMGCLAATIVRKLKDEHRLGGIYLMVPGSTDHGEEYVYTISEGTGPSEIRMKVEAIRGGYTTPRTTTLLFEGRAEDFDASKIEEEDE